MKKINIFENEVDVKDHLCSTNKNNCPSKCKVSLRLYIKVTDDCQCNCKFCANENLKDFGNLDLKKLDYVIRYLYENKILHGISITGGEPMINPDKLNDVINLIYNISSDIEVAISTNGLNFKLFKEFDNVNKLESIHLSRHHYNDIINSEIFRSKNVAKTEDIMLLQEYLADKRIININTLVMKGYIDSLKEIKNMLNYVGETGVYKNGFVSLMKCNEFAKERFINFNSIFNNLDENFFLAHHFYSKDYCECVDGVYITNNDKLVEFYARMVKESLCDYVNQLVYTSDNKVTAGFGGKVLLK
ncbi:MAG: radical SAM protein [Bacilli bacterium]|nr:radical SAM protein [Bacilli bacterium]